MILQALYDYYQRKLALNKIDPLGLITKEIDFFIIIDKEGNYVDFENLRTQEGRRIKGTPFQVPLIGKQAQKHDNSGKDANLLWDKAEFVLGVGKNSKHKLESFINTIKEYFPRPTEDILAILNFYNIELSSKSPFKKIIENKEIGEVIRKGNAILTFKLSNKMLPVTSESNVLEAIQTKIRFNEPIGTCLITGKTKAKIETTHLVIKGIKGTQTSGANIVSFNLQSSLSYNKEQSENAPISKMAAEAYVKALQNLVDSEHNKITIADSTIVFWSEKQTTEINPEEIFPWVIAMQKSEKDDPDAGVIKIKKLFEAIQTGQLTSEKTNYFYVLGLAPNAARISIRFWKAPSIEDFGKNIKQHFEDFEIAHKNYESKYISLYDILSSVSIETKKRDKPNIIFYKGKAYDVLPQLAGQVVEAVLDNYLYPQSLLQQCLIRIRAEASKKDKEGKPIPNVNRTRAAILKAFLNRKNRIQKQNQKEITMSLDLNNSNVGYLLGRLFAVIERAQFVSNNYKEPNSGIRDRFFGAFSSSPISVLPILEKLYSHHYKKIKNEGKYREANRIEDWKKNIIDKLEAIKIPAHLTLENQALFTIGYYHQKMEIENQKNYNQEKETTNQQKES